MPDVGHWYSIKGDRIYSEPILLTFVTFTERWMRAAWLMYTQ